MNATATPPPLERHYLDLTTLYRETHAGLRRAAIGLGVSPDAAEDLVQSTFLVAHVRLPHFDGRSKPSTWLYGILFNVHRNQHRAVERAQRREHAHAQLEVVAQRTHTPEAAYANCLFGQLVQDLDERHQRVLMLYVEDGLSGREISALLGLKLSMAYSLLHAAWAIVQGRYRGGC